MPFRSDAQFVHNGSKTCWEPTPHCRRPQDGRAGSWRSRDGIEEPRHHSRYRRGLDTDSARHAHHDHHRRQVRQPLKLDAYNNGKTRYGYRPPPTTTLRCPSIPKPMARSTGHSAVIFASEERVNCAGSDAGNLIAAVASNSGTHDRYEHEPRVDMANAPPRDRWRLSAFSKGGWVRALLEFRACTRKRTHGRRVHPQNSEKAEPAFPGRHHLGVAVPRFAAGHDDHGFLPSWPSCSQPCWRCTAAEQQHIQRAQ